MDATEKEREREREAIAMGTNVDDDDDRGDQKGFLGTEGEFFSTGTEKGERS